MKCSTLEQALDSQKLCHFRGGGIAETPALQEDLLHPGIGKAMTSSRPLVVKNTALSSALEGCPRPVQVPTFAYRVSDRFRFADDSGGGLVTDA